MKEWIPKDNLPSSVTFICPYCNGRVTYHHGSSSKSRKNSGLTKRCLYTYCPWCQEKVEPYRANIITTEELAMKEQDDRDCNTCLFYEPMEGVCELKKEPRHGYDKPCSQWEDWEDNAK